jgi:hypothetical protein
LTNGNGKQLETGVFIDKALDFPFLIEGTLEGTPAVPEPSMMVIGTLFGLGGLMAKRRMKK